MAPAIYNQPQITEGSHVLIFAAWKEYSDENVEKYLNNIATVRGIPVESLDGMRNMITVQFQEKLLKVVELEFSSGLYCALEPACCSRRRTS